MPAQQYIINIRGPFKEIESVEQALQRCENKLHKQINSVTDITSIPNERRVALLVEFVGGLKVKLVVAPSDHMSLEKFRFLERLPLNVPRVLTGDKNWVAFEWIDGPTLRQHGLNDIFLREAARTLANIHSFQIPERSKASKKVLGRVHRKLKRKLPVLVSNDILSEKEHDEILNLSRSMSNKVFDVSMIHADFSPDNLVVHGTKLWSVDNDKITGHASDYDLCRSVSLWDEWNSSGADLFVAYVESSNRSVPREDLFFWGVFDLVYRISYRISLGEVNDFCIRRLRETLTTGEFR